MKLLIMKSNKRLVITFSILIVITMLSLCLINKTVFASNSKNNTYKMVTSIEIKKGDTLWSIANEYKAKDCSNLKAYVKEIITANGLLSDTIHEGGYLIIPYDVAYE